MPLRILILCLGFLPSERGDNPLVVVFGVKPVGAHTALSAELTTLCRCCYSLSGVRLFVTPWTGARQALLPMGFSRQAY